MESLEQPLMCAREEEAIGYEGVWQKNAIGTNNSVPGFSLLGIKYSDPVTEASGEQWDTEKNTGKKEEIRTGRAG